MSDAEHSKRGTLKELKVAVSTLGLDRVKSVSRLTSFRYIVFWSGPTQRIIIHSDLDSPRLIRIMIEISNPHHIQFKRCLRS